MGIAVVIVGFYLCSAQFKSKIDGMAQSTQKCLTDFVLELLRPLTLSENFQLLHRRYFRFYIILDALLIDLFFLHFAFNWVFASKFYTTVISLLLFYVMRQCVVSMIDWPIPDFQDFEDPHFPSLVVSYRKTNDFYYSGHIGFCLIMMLQNISERSGCAMILLNSWLLVFTGFMLLITRAHYTNDLFIGLVVAYNIFWVSAQVVYFLRYYLALGVFRSFDFLGLQKLSKLMSKEN